MVIAKNSYSQAYNMDNTSVSTCFGLFYDSGGPSGNFGALGICSQGTYSNNEDYTKTFCSDNGQNIMFTFDELNIVGTDWLKVYDGNSTAAPLLMTLTSASTSPTIIASGTCLTFQFHSNNNGTTSWLSGSCDDGGDWSASIQCVTIYPINSVPPIANTCSGIFVDDGGMSGNYSPNADFTKTFCPSGASCVKLNFSSLSLGAGDVLTFFSGSSAVGAPIATLTSGSPIPPLGISSNSGDCLTIQFTSDGVGNAAGWAATIFCPPSCGTLPICTTNPPANDQCINATPICNLNGFCGNTSNTYTPLDQNGVDWDNVQGLDFCGSIENESWLSFIADAPTAELNVWTMNCANNQGIQMEIYETTDCQNFTPHSNCVSVGSPTDFSIQAYGLVPGNRYYLLIDGYGGDNCDFVIAAANGIDVGGQITAEQTICEGATTNITLDGAGAGANYSWSSIPNDPSMIITGNSINISPLLTTTYFVTVTGPSANPLCPPINQSFQTIVNVVSDTSSYCQPNYTCNITASVNDTSICAGESVNLAANGSITLTLLANDFNTGVVGLGWNATTNASFNNPCGLGPDGTTCLWMGDQSPAPRRLESNDFDVQYGGDIFFYLRYAVQDDGSPCEGPDEIDEGITLQYSINNGLSWTAIAYFNPSGVVEPNGNIYQGQSSSVASGNTPFTSWAQYTFPVPAGAMTPSSRFRWIQEVSTDFDYDHWGLDSIWVRANAPNVQLNWTSNPSGFTYAGAIPPPVSPAVTTTYIATVSNGNFSCSDSVRVTVVNISTDFTVSDTTQCKSNNTFNFINQGPVGVGVNYLWNFGDGTLISPLQNPAHSYVNSGTYIVKQKVQSGTCVDSVYHNVYVYAEPTLTFDSIPSCMDTCTGTLIVYPTGTPWPFSYNWSNGSISQAITGVCGNNYTVIVTDGNGCSTMASTDVTEYPAPSVNIDSVPSCHNVCNGSLTAYGFGTTGPYNYYWSNFINAQTINNLCVGNYTVTVKDGNSCSGTGTNVVVYYPDISVTLSSTRVKCNSENNGSATAIASGGGGNGFFSYQWGYNANSQTSSTATVLYAGDYWVTITDNLGCIIDTSVIVTQPDLLVITTSPDTSLCYHTSGSLYAYPLGGTSPFTYYWNGTVAGSPLMVDPEYSTAYSVYVTDSNNCVSNTSTIYVTVDLKLQIHLYAEDTMVCPGSNAVINAYVNGGDGGPYYLYDWQWNNIEMPYKPFPATSPQNFYLIAKDRCGAVARDTIAIYLHPLPLIMFTSDRFSGCQPLTVQFNEGTDNTGSDYTWSFNDATNSLSHSRNPVHTFEDAGVYDISLSITSLEGCQNTYTIPAMITVYPNPEARFISEPEIVSIIEPIVTFYNHSSNYVMSIWHFDDGDSSLFNSPIHVYKETGKYDVTLVAISDHGCKDSTKQEIVVRDEYSFYAPTAFSPDADGINDVFNVYGHGINPKKFVLTIFDRWGQVLFETTDLTKGWDGKLKKSSSGKDIVKSGVYTWFVIYFDLSGVVHQQSGPVTVIH